MGAYDSFLKKLDAFIRKFYLDKALRGFLLLVCFLLLLFALFSLLEYLSFFSTPVRSGMFWTFTGLACVGFVFLVLLPLLRAFGLLRRMSYREAARYLSSRYPELDDKLYNVLDLEESRTGDADVPEALLDAAIEQVSSRFVSYRFEKIVRLKANRPYLYVLLSLVLLFVLVGIWNPRLWQSSERIVHYERAFARDFPFSIRIADSVLNVPYEEDFTLDILAEGSALPSEASLVFDGRVVACKKVEPGRFTYVFRKVQRDIPFRIVTGKYQSGEFLLKVDYKPLLSSMRVVLHYPPYTGLEPEAVENTLDLEVPHGTRLEWNLLFEHARDLEVFELPGRGEGKVLKSLEVDTSGRPLFVFSKTALQSFRYALVPLPFSEFPLLDTLSFSVNVLPDAYPRIEVQQYLDSSDVEKRFFTGHIVDDYGFSALYFNLHCFNNLTGNEWDWADTLAIDFPVLEQEFSYHLDWKYFPINPGDELTYGFEVRDNDALAGFKPAYSSVFSYRKMSEEEVREEIAKTSASIGDNFSLSLQSMRAYEKEVADMIESLISKQAFTWQDRQDLELLLERRQELEHKYEEIKNELERKSELESTLDSENKVLEEKRRELESLMERLFDESVMDKLAELQRLMEENKPKEDLIDALEDLRKQSNLSVEDLERNMNLYKQLEFENRLENLISDAKELHARSEELHDLMQDLKASEFSSEKDSLSSLLSDLEERKQDLESDLLEADRLNSDLEKPTSFSVPDSLLDAISKKMQETSSHIGGADGKSAVKSQQETSDMFQSLVSDLEGQQEKIEQETAAEDAAFLRLLLKSVLRVSFNQENLLSDLAFTRVNDPYYAEIIRKQSSLNTEITFVVDSVRAISKRQPQVALTTDREVKNLLDYSSRTLALLLRMNNVHYQRYGMSNSNARTYQQYTMTSLNNLALLLSESLDKMQSQLAMKGNSSGNQKGMPQMSSSGKGKTGKMPMPSLANPGSEQNLQKMQESLNRQLEALKKMLEEQAGKMQEGKASTQSGSGKSGNSQGQDATEEKVSEAFARAAAQQEMIRRILQERLQQEKAANPSSVGKYNQILGEMEQTERDLVNRVLNERLLARQKRIETRLLEAENAELRREKDNERESKEGRQFSPYEIDSLPVFFEKRQSSDVLKENIPALQPYYKKKVQDYFFD